MRVINIDPASPDRRKIDQAAHIIKNGGVIVFPTDTVYGIGADAGNIKAVHKIFRIKGREKKKSLILFVSRKKDVEKIAAGISCRARTLIRRFWPGSLTLIFKSLKTVLYPVKNRSGTVGVRMPADAVLLKIIKRSGVALATTSANFSGDKSAADIKEIPLKFLLKTDALVNTGKIPCGKESTVVDVTRQPFVVLREGAVPAKKLGIKTEK